MRILKLILFLYFVVITKGYAQTYLGGYLRTEAITNNKYKIIVEMTTTQTPMSSRPTIPIVIYSDNYTKIAEFNIPLKSQVSYPVRVSAQKTIYEGEYTFNSVPFLSGTYYKISCKLENRYFNIINYNVLGGSNRELYLETRLFIGNSILNFSPKINQNLFGYFLITPVTQMPFSNTFDLSAVSSSSDSLSYEVNPYYTDYNKTLAFSISLIQNPLSNLGLIQVSNLTTCGAYAMSFKIRQWKKRNGTNIFYEIGHSYVEYCFTLDCLP